LGGLLGAGGMSREGWRRPWSWYWRGWRDSWDWEGGVGGTLAGVLEGLEGLVGLGGRGGRDPGKSIGGVARDRWDEYRGSEGTLGGVWRGLHGLDSWDWEGWGEGTLVVGWGLAIELNSLGIEVVSVGGLLVAGSRRQQGRWELGRWELGSWGLGKEGGRECRGQQ
jgi:hypothetical protein